MNKFKAVAFLGLFTMVSPVMAAVIQGDVFISGVGKLDHVPSSSSPNATTVAMASTGSIGGGTTSPTGDFDTYLNPGDAATYNTGTITFEPAFFGSIPGFWSAGGFSFDLTSLQQVVEVNGFINLNGLGTITGNGFDATSGKINIAGVGSSVNVAINIETLAETQNVPEPLAMSLIGLGLIGIGAATKLRKKV